MNVEPPQPHARADGRSPKVGEYRARCTVCTDTFRAIRERYETSLLELSELTTTSECTRLLCNVRDLNEQFTLSWIDHVERHDKPRKRICCAFAHRDCLQARSNYEHRALVKLLSKTIPTYDSILEASRDEIDYLQEGYERLLALESLNNSTDSESVENSL